MFQCLHNDHHPSKVSIMHGAVLSCITCVKIGCINGDECIILMVVDDQWFQSATNK